MNVHVGEAQGWTDQRINLLKELWGKGYSASQCAAALGVTRNGVMGKVHRLKLDKRVSPQVLSPAHKAAVSRGVRAALGKKPPKVKPAPEMKPIERAAQIEADPLPEIDDGGVDVTRLIGLIELTNHSCRWPYGDPRLPTFGFCGKPISGGRSINDAGSPYCAAHTLRSVSQIARRS